MRIVSCVTEAETLFKETRTLTVHSVYRQVVNLWDGERMFSLHGASMGRTPLSLTLDEETDEWWEMGLKAGMNVVFQKDSIILDGMCIDCGGRTHWNPVLDIRLSKSACCRMVREIERELPKFRDRGGFSDAAVCRLRKEDDLVTRILRERLWALRDFPGNPSDCLVSLIGMGSGLTPSGDDFLTGVLLMLRVSNFEKTAWTEYVANEIRRNVDRTNDLSGQFLLRACMGEFGEKLHRLVCAVRQGKSCVREIDETAKTGHSSGIDTLTGIVAGWCLIGRGEERG